MIANGTKRDQLTQKLTTIGHCTTMSKADTA